MEFEKKFESITKVTFLSFEPAIFTSKLLILTFFVAPDHMEQSCVSSYGELHVMLIVLIDSESSASLTVGVETHPISMNAVVRNVIAFKFSPLGFYIGSNYSYKCRFVCLPFRGHTGVKNMIIVLKSNDCFPPKVGINI